MSEKKLKPGWKIWRFDQMATSVTDRIDNPAEADVEHYVGLEHLDSDSLKIRRWGVPTDVEATKLRFRKGDIIFGRRRVYQRKVGVAEFDGICSAHALVLRPKTDVVLPEFLPFFMQSDLFMNRALEISVGSLSPTINWKTLASQEFNLPPMEEQRRIAALLLTIERVIEEKLELANETQSLLHSAISSGFLGAFGPKTIKEQFAKLGEFPQHWEICKLATITKKIVDGVHKRPDYTSSGVPFLTVENLTRGPKIDFSNTRFVTAEDHKEFCKRAYPEKGDVLVTKDGTLGVARVVEEEKEFSIFVSLALLKPIEQRINPWFLKFYFDSPIFLRMLGSKTSGSALKHIHVIDFRETLIPLPPLDEQEKIVEVLFAIEQAMRRTQREVTDFQLFKSNMLSTILTRGA